MPRQNALHFYLEHIPDACPCERSARILVGSIGAATALSPRGGDSGNTRFYILKYIKTLKILSNIGNFEPQKLCWQSPGNHQANLNY